MTLLQGGVVRRLPPYLTQKSAVLGLYLIIPSFITSKCKRFYNSKNNWISKANFKVAHCLIV